MAFVNFQQIAKVLNSPTNILYDGFLEHFQYRADAKK